MAYVYATLWSVQCHQHTPLVSFCIHDPGALAVDFEQVIISVILLTMFFANQIMIVSRLQLMYYWYYLVCLIPGHGLLTCYLKQVIVLVICFLPCLLTRYWFIYVSSTCVTSFIAFAFTVCGLNLNRSLFRFHCIWHHLLTRYWFVQYQQLLHNRVILQYNSGKMTAEFEQVTVLIHFFSLRYCVFTLS